MSTSQELIDYLNTQITNLDNRIAVKEQEKISSDVEIEGFEANIVLCNDRKTTADGVIAALNAEKAKINEIIAVIPAD